MTNISWCINPGSSTSGQAWNPIRAEDRGDGRRGWHCEKVSAGCDHCYAERQNFKGGNSGGTGLLYNCLSRDRVRLYLDERTLTVPLRRRKPTGYFISMTDPFGAWVPDEWLDRLFAVMALCPQHRFYVLTKRSERMRGYLSCGRPHLVGLAVLDQTILSMAENPKSDVGKGITLKGAAHLVTWPLPNVRLGATVENQVTADTRRDDMAALDAGGWFTWVSSEPRLGPIDWSGWEFIRQLVTGGETGPGARPCRLDWARADRDWCAERLIAFFFKQWGEWRPDAMLFTDVYGRCPPSKMRVGKKAAGRLLDGREHQDVPE